MNSTDPLDAKTLFILKWCFYHDNIDWKRFELRVCHKSRDEWSFSVGAVRCVLTRGFDTTGIHHKKSKLMVDTMLSEDLTTNQNAEEYG